MLLTIEYKNGNHISEPVYWVTYKKHTLTFMPNRSNIKGIGYYPVSVKQRYIKTWYVEES